ncbi:DUF3558 family protein [Actinopolyspora mortivallis]|uniref:DUF3558 family protein n=1 Tax=Actinopolyspora mortivallis TaxID=33906 RepID=UPI00037DB0BA|nr:DUF3558 family protein [Actinopolyspora mortivallis]
MTPHRSIRGLLAVVCLCTVTACGGESPDRAKDGSGGGVAKSSEAPSGDPFAVPEALDLSAAFGPCELLTRRQVERLGAGRPQPDGESAWGQEQCRWKNESFSVVLAPDTTQKQGLKFAAYTSTADGEPTHEVKEYPAVHGNGKTETRCSTIVGTSREDVIYVSFAIGTDGRDDPEYARPCAMSDRIAGMMLENLPAE